MNQEDVNKLIKLNERLIQQNNTLIHLITTYITAPDGMKNSVVLKLAEANDKVMKNNNENLLPK